MLSFHKDKGLMMARFGIEFAPEVVQADGTVRNLAWRICNAKKVLVSHLRVVII